MILFLLLLIAAYVLVGVYAYQNPWTHDMWLLNWHWSGAGDPPPSGRAARRPPAAAPRRHQAPPHHHSPRPRGAPQPRRHAAPRRHPDHRAPDGRLPAGAAQLWGSGAQLLRGTRAGGLL